jgi:hypothetical protein
MLWPPVQGWGEPWHIWLVLEPPLPPPTDVLVHCEAQASVHVLLPLMQLPQVGLMPCWQPVRHVSSPGVQAQ